MCVHEFYYSSACGHHFPKLDRPPKPKVYFDEPCRTLAVPQSLTCNAVKLALKFYHDQVVYLPADMNHGAKVEIPRSCPIVHPTLDGMTREAVVEQNRADEDLRNAMLRNGLDLPQKRQVEIDAATLDQCSNRAKPGQHSVAELRRHKRQAYPMNMYDHVQKVKVYQEEVRRYMKPNVRYYPVEFGCGGPFSPECLTGWDGIKLLAHRLHLWDDYTTHPKPCNHECLLGWSGADLDTYRQQTWAGHDPTAFLSLDNIGYAKLARQHMVEHFGHTGRFAILDFRNIRHRHPDQLSFSEYQPHQRQRIGRFWDAKVEQDKEVHVPYLVQLPLPRRLDQGLAELNWISSCAEVSESHAAAANGPGVRSTSVETPEMAEARRRKARDEIREKIARDFSNGEGRSVVGEDTDCAKL